MTTRIGIIGAGLYCATTHVPALQAMEGVEVVATCRSRPDKLRAFNDHFGIPNGYTDYRRLLTEEALDGVIVASPHDLHYEHARAVLERGLPLLLEKPMTVTLAEADALCDLAESNRVPVVVGYNRQYWHPFETASAMLHEGRLGDLLSLSAMWRSNLIWALEECAYTEQQKPMAFWQPGDPPNFRAGTMERGGGAMADAGAHLCHAVTFLAQDRPREVSAWYNQAGTEHDVNWSVHVRFAGGALGSLTFLGQCPELKTHEVTLVGTRGVMRVDDQAVEWAPRGGEVERVPKAYQKSVAENFVRVIRGEEAPVCTIDDGRHAQALLNAILDSASTGAPVGVQTRNGPR